MTLLCILHRPFLHIDKRCILSVHGYGRQAYMYAYQHIARLYHIYLLYVHILFIGPSYTWEKDASSRNMGMAHLYLLFCLKYQQCLYSLPVGCTGSFYTWTEDSSPLYLGKVYSLSILFQHCKYIFHTVNIPFLNMNEGYVFTEHGIHTYISFLCVLQVSLVFFANSLYGLHTVSTPDVSPPYMGIGIIKS
jgi:hypothetical protein